MSIFINILLAIHVIVSLLIILVTLMQRPKNEGLGAAFGGGMTENLFGAQTSNVLAKFTRWLGGTFFGLTLLLSILYARQSTAKSAIQKELLNAPRPIATPAAAASATPASAEKSDNAMTVTPVLPGGSPAAATPTGAASPAKGLPSAAAAASPVTAAPSPSAAPVVPAAPEKKP